MATHTGELIANTPLVRVRELSRSHGPRGVLAGVDLDICPGEFIALLGRSGSGKSTLLRAVAELDRGVAGSGVLSVPEHRAVVFQDARLLPWARVLDNVVLGLPGSDAAQRGRRALREVGLAGREQAWPIELSGGEQQRVALARALVMEPRVLLADEPTGNLDTHTGEEMHKLVVELNRDFGMTLVVVTHNPDFAARLPRRVRMVDGLISDDA
jgi:sulfonate transport system ATP-binding protein